MPAPQRIFAADDDRAAVCLIRDHFESLGCRVTCAVGGLEALAVLVDADFDRVYNN